MNNKIPFYKTLFFKLVATLALVALPICAGAIQFYFATQGQESDGRRINVAGKQRMLSQKMSKEVFEYKAGMINAAAVRETAEEFDRSLSDLQIGNPERGLAATDDESVLAQLATVKKLWKPFQENLEKVLSAPADKDVQAELEYISKNNVPLLKEMNKAVVLYEAGFKESLDNLVLGRLVSVAFTAVLLGFATWNISGVVRRLNLASAYTRKLANGDFSESKMEVTGSDELDGLCSAINELKQFNDELLRDMSENASQLTNSSRGLTKSSEKLASGSQNLDKTSNTLTTESNYMKERIESISSSSQEIENSSRDISVSMNEMGSVINEVAGNCEKGASIASDATEKAQVAVNAINELGERAKQIDDVVRVINDIAEQTNLLALNATIEAASAGEAGKGFSVVANEVKELARKSADSTDNIKKQIQEIQAKTSDSISAIETTGKIIQELNEISATIAAAVHEQSSTTDSITAQINTMSQSTVRVRESIEGIKENVIGVTNSAENISKDTAETNTTSQYLLEDSKGLEGMSQRMVQALQKVKLADMRN